LDACHERREADKLAAHGTRSTFLACSALRSSIDDAVRHGDISVVDEAVGVVK
jgi:hypothetical protein